MTIIQVAGVILAYLITVYIAYGLTVWWEVRRGLSRDFREMRGLLVTLWPFALIGVAVLAVGYTIYFILAIPADFIHDTIYRKATSR